MHFAVRGYLFIALIALLGIAGTWSDEPVFAGAWLLPAFLLLAGLAAEAWYARGTRVDMHVRLDSRLRLGRPAHGAFAFNHNRGREIELQYARVLPPALAQSTAKSMAIGRVTVPPEDGLRDPCHLVPLRLGAGRFAPVPGRILGRFSLAWWSRSLGADAPFSVAPDSKPRGARSVPGESAGETPRRLPGAGVELLQLREYVSGDALSRIDWKATARRGTLVSREYSEAQHLEILIVIDAGRASRVRAGALDRLGLYANVAARLAQHAVSSEDRVGLLVYADRMLGACLPDRGMRAATRLHRTLETLVTDRAESNPLVAAIQVRRILRHRGLIVWLTDLAEPARTDRLMHALKAIVPRHLPIVAAPHASEIAQLAQAEARDWRDPGIALAAREHHERAQVQVATLRRQGIVVLDEPDDKLDQAVLDAYLLLRQRKRI
jgi:uncharacterized protein (DUF58 family)